MNKEDHESNTPQGNEKSSIENEIITVNSVPPYIDNFLIKNNLKLEEIYDEGIETNKKGCLLLTCSQKENKMDVSFLNINDMDHIINVGSWESIISNSNGKKIYIVKDDFEDNKNQLFIIYI